MHNNQEGKAITIPRKDTEETSMLYDRFGRKLNSLRISVTQRCNLRCFFCHKEGEVASTNEMTTQEIAKIAKAASELGMRKVKLTGGGPPG